MSIHIKVQFNNVEEFLDELHTRGPDLERVLRLTKTFHTSGTMPALQYVHVVAGYLRQCRTVLQLVELDRPVGDILAMHNKPTDEHDQKVYDKADEYMKRIDFAATKAGLTIAAGTYQLPKE